MAITLCPIALAVGCRKCPAFSVCPLKSVIGDQHPGPGKPLGADEPTIQRKKGSRGKSRAKRRGGRGRPRRGR